MTAHHMGSKTLDGPYICLQCKTPWPCKARDTSQWRLRRYLRLQLRLHSMTQKQLALRAGISEKHLSQLLNGKTGITLDMADNLLACFGQAQLCSYTFRAYLRDLTDLREDAQ